MGLLPGIAAKEVDIAEPILSEPGACVVEACQAADLSARVPTGRNFKMAEERTFIDILTEQVNQVSGGIEVALRRHLAAFPSIPWLSAATEKHIAKRVPPKVLRNYLSPDSAISLLSLEISDLGMRISHYQYIERYREHFSPPDAAMRAAFVMHTHILRGSEIYVIMERCGSCLGFFHDLAADLDLGPTKMAKSLEKQFKKEFERHLRERHRIVHAQERPSLVSRMIGVHPDELAQPDVVEKYATIIGTLAEALTASLGEAANQKSPAEKFAMINDLRLRAVDKECFQMWSIFLGCINKLIDSAKLRK